MSKSLERILFYICLTLGAITLTILTLSAKADSLCPEGTVAVAPFSAEQKEAIARLKRHDADLAIAHAKKQPDTKVLQDAINRLLRYKADMALVCGVKP